MEGFFVLYLYQVKLYLKLERIRVRIIVLLLFIFLFLLLLLLGSEKTTELLAHQVCLILEHVCSSSISDVEHYATIKKILYSVYF